LALALEIPNEQWHRLLALIVNDGEDVLLDRIIVSRSPDRKIGTVLLYPKPYGRLLKAVDAPADSQAPLLKAFVEYWYQASNPDQTRRRSAIGILIGIPMATRTLKAGLILAVGV
jgi:Domain of unknown function (DUF1911).